MQIYLKWVFLGMIMAGVQLWAAPPPTPVVAASDGTYADKVHIVLSNASISKKDPTHQIYRSESAYCEQETGCIKIYDGGLIAYDDMSIEVDTMYYYWARSCSSVGGCSAYSESDTGYAHLNNPSSSTINASDGTYEDKVALNITAVEGATSYKIYRSIKNSLPVSEYQTVTSTYYNDMSVTSGTTYYYWVKACNSSGCSAASASNSGYAKIPVPPKSGIDASDGTYKDKVALNITPVDIATSYKIYRSIHDILPSNEYQTVTSTHYDDTTMIIGMTYYYWVKACNSSGCSAVSASNSGYAEVPIPPMSTIDASDSAFYDRIVLEIASVNGATSYKIYRALTDFLPNSEYITINSTQYNDTAVTPGTGYYYWVKACNDSGCSDASPSDRGVRAAVIPSEATVSASDGNYSGQVILDITPVEGADIYYIHRAYTDTYSEERIAYATSTQYIDTQVTPITLYYYWIEACNASGCSVGPYDTGYARYPVPSAITVSASDGNYSDKIVLNLIPEEGVNAYHIRRALTDTYSEAYRIGYTNASHYTDTEVVPGTTYYYWIEACNASGCSVGSYDTGYARYPKPPETTIDASDGVYFDKIALNIAPSLGATSYKIYRSMSDSLPNNEYTTVTSTHFNDISASRGVNYYYWVVACNASGCGEVSSFDKGWLQEIQIPILAIPQEVNATNENPDGKIIITYSAVENATYYKIYRSSLPVVDENTYAGRSESIAWEDQDRQDGIFNYWVKACDDNGCSEFSTLTSGEFNEFDINSINDINLSIHNDDQRIKVRFTLYDEVDHYILYRSLSPDFTEEVTQRSYSDIRAKAEYSYWLNAFSTTAEVRDPGPSFFHEPLKSYYYRVAACNSDESVCKMSNSASGKIPWLHHNNPILKHIDDNHVLVAFPIDDSSAFRNEYNLYDKIEIYRSETELFSDATLLASRSNPSNNEDRIDAGTEWDEWKDYFVEHDTTYHYWLRYCNDYGCSNPTHEKILIMPGNNVAANKTAMVIVQEYGDFIEGNITWYQTPPKDLLPDDLEVKLDYIRNNIIAPIEITMEEIGDSTFISPSLTSLQAMLESVDRKIMEELQQHQNSLFARTVTEIHNIIDKIKEDYPYLPLCAQTVLNTFYEYGNTDQDLVTYVEELGACQKEIATPFYDKVVLLTDENASFSNFKTTLKNLHDQGYFIDIVYGNHGGGVDKNHTLNNTGTDVSGLCFYAENGSGCDYRIKEDFINKIANLFGRMNIGTVYMTSCWGSQMSDAWFGIGAKEVNGAFQLNWYGGISPLVFLDQYLRAGKSFKEATEIAYQIDDTMRFGKPVMAELDLRPAMDLIFPILEEAPIPCGIEINGVWIGLSEIRDEYSNNKDYCQGSILMVPYEFETICPPFYSKKYRQGKDRCTIDVLGSIRDEMHWEYDLSEKRRKEDYQSVGRKYGYDTSKPIDISESSRRVNKVAPFVNFVTRIQKKEGVARLYVATFNRAPDAAGLNYWLNDSGLQLEQIAQSFFDQPETQEAYPSGSTNADFIEAVYLNLFNRTPDQGGLSYWAEELNSGHIARSVFILAVINGAQNTVEFGNDASILANKMAVGLEFANAGLNDTNDAKDIMHGVTDDGVTIMTALDAYDIVDGEF